MHVIKDDVRKDMSKRCIHFQPFERIDDFGIVYCTKDGLPVKDERQLKS